MLTSRSASTSPHICYEFAFNLSTPNFYEFLYRSCKMVNAKRRGRAGLCSLGLAITQKTAIIQCFQKGDAMRQSMTGFANKQGTGHGLRWSWELRGVNAKGLDVRVRVPDWIDGLEVGLRKILSARISRGSVTVGLRINASGERASVLRLDLVQMDAVLDAFAALETEAADRGLHLAPSTAADLLGQRGVMELAVDETDPKALCDKLLLEFDEVAAAFVQMRQSEGAALAAILLRHLQDIEGLVSQAETEVERRRDAQNERLSQALERITLVSDMDPDRVAQELALIAVKSDITEEIDRLRSHITAAYVLVSDPKPVGRKLDFLMQEFNREANTLCSKAQSSGLTAVGLEMKTVIDQMREQVQNVE
jgi:uncharacterized protein (TIGR00255 family)